jgi:pyruvate formate lyase activating enzyme
MNIQGLQKTTLLDYPGKIAATVFTGGCNFRCPFCHNASLVLNDRNAQDISEEVFFDLLAKRKGLLDGVCISGGEPLLQREIGRFISEIKSLGFLVKLDTNGSFPSKLQGACRRRVNRLVAMDIKNSHWLRENGGNNRRHLPEVKQSVTFLLAAMLITNSHNGGQRVSLQRGLRRNRGVDTEGKEILPAELCRLR